jgi:hypothetical protein
MEGVAKKPACYPVVIYTTQQHSQETSICHNCLTRMLLLIDE